MKELTAIAGRHRAPQAAAHRRPARGRHRAPSLWRQTVDAVKAQLALHAAAREAAAAADAWWRQRQIDYLPALSRRGAWVPVT